MNERRRPHRRRPRAAGLPTDDATLTNAESGDDDVNPYRESGGGAQSATTAPDGEVDGGEPAQARAPRAPREPGEPRAPREPREPRERPAPAPRAQAEEADGASDDFEATAGAAPPPSVQPPQGGRPERPDRGERFDRTDRGDRNNTAPGSNNANNNANNDRFERGGRRNRRNRGRDRTRGGPVPAGAVERPQHEPRGGAPAPAAIVADTDVVGWFESSRDGGYVRRAENSYLADPADAFVPPHVLRQFAMRRGDEIRGRAGRDHRGRLVLSEIASINDLEPSADLKRPDFATLTATYPERKLTLETGRPARSGPELTRRAVDLIAPIGYGQRALIVAPARAGKTMLMHAITEGIAINHPGAVLLILLVDERPEEVSEAISWGVGEVIASSFDQPAERHVEVTEIVLERARRLVELGRDVVIVLDSLTRMARAHNTAERGTGRTLSGGLDASAMAKPKAFFGSARAVVQTAGGGSLTIISTALVETGSRMDDVIFEEFKGTGNCEIKLDRSLAERRIFPAFDVASSGTRREEKLFRPEQLDSVHTLRRGLHQMPPQASMEWLIKRIAGTPNNDTLLAGL